MWMWFPPPVVVRRVISCSIVEHAACFVGFSLVWWGENIRRILDVVVKEDGMCELNQELLAGLFLLQPDWS